MLQPRRLYGKFADRACRFYKALRNCYNDSPPVFVVAIVVVVLLLLLGSAFTSHVASYVGSHGAAVVDVALFWLFARFVARALLFPGSVQLFQRNTEATFRTELSRQYAQLVRQLWSFLRLAARRSEGLLHGVSAEGILRGYAVIEGLSSAFQLQQTQHGIGITKTQLEIEKLAKDIQRWTKPAHVKTASVSTPLLEWLRQAAVTDATLQHRKSSRGASLESIRSAELVGDPQDIAAIIEGLERLLAIFDGLRKPAESKFAAVTRFIRAPAVGSLDQLRAELQIRFSGHRFWVTTQSSHQIDCMFIPFKGLCGWAASDGTDDAGTRETAPLTGNPVQPNIMFSGPTIIWCNPNAAYYETMVYQVSWLNFWLNRGCNLLLFNYSGYGRSTGNPSPGKVTENVDAVINFLKAKGISQIGVYGRSIGGICACHLARANPDVVKLLIADRTMSRLEAAAKYLYGNWASNALQATRMVHNNVDNFIGVRCYKLLLVDPKDAMILDLAALRTEVAARAVERMSPEEVFAVDDKTLKSLADVWQFFQRLFTICEADEDGLGSDEGGGSARPARQPAFRAEDSRDNRTQTASETSSVAGANPGSIVGRDINTAWLQDHAALVRLAVGPVVDQLRSTLDVIGELLEAGGSSLNDVLLDNPKDGVSVLRSFLTNLQVWGTLGDRSGHLEESSDFEGGTPVDVAEEMDKKVELILRKDLAAYLSQDSGFDLSFAKIPADAISDYHRRLSRKRVTQAKRELRRRLSVLQASFSSPVDISPDSSDQVERIYKSIQARLADVESFLGLLGKFFKSVDLALPNSKNLSGDIGQGDSSDEKSYDNFAQTEAHLKPLPPLDHSTIGYIMHLDCGHNGLLDEVECRHLALHLRRAGFGTVSPEF